MPGESPTPQVVGQDLPALLPPFLQHAAELVLGVLPAWGIGCTWRMSGSRRRLGVVLPCVVMVCNTTPPCLC